MYPEITKSSLDKDLSKVLIVGHGSFSMRQRPSYSQWVAEGVEVHCADVDPRHLETCPDGVIQHDLSEVPESQLLKTAPFDLVLVNNYPQLHLATALKYSSSCSGHIIIPAPHDLNANLISTLASAPGFADFRAQLRIHDHYRNKDAFPAFLEVLPLIHQHYGQFQRICLFLVECRSVND